MFCEWANCMVSQISFLICQKGIILALPIFSELKKTLETICQTTSQFTNHRGTLRTWTFYLFFRLKIISILVSDVQQWFDIYIASDVMYTVNLVTICHHIVTTILLTMFSVLHTTFLFFYRWKFVLHIPLHLFHSSPESPPLWWPPEENRDILELAHLHTTGGWRGTGSWQAPHYYLSDPPWMGREEAGLGLGCLEARGGLLWPLLSQSCTTGLPYTLGACSAP